MYHCLREYFSFGNAINKPRRWSHAKVSVNGRSFCKRLLQKHEAVPLTRVNMAALLKPDISSLENSVDPDQMASH